MLAYFARLSLSFAFLACATAPLFAAGSPPDPVTAVYKAATAHKDRSVIQDKTVLKRYFTLSFQAVMASIDKREEGTGEAVLDFDPVLAMNGDGDASALVIKTEREEGDHAQVTATFGRGKARRAVAYVLARERGEWRIDDITSAPGTKGDMTWSVRKISDSDLAARAKEKK